MATFAYIREAIGCTNAEAQEHDLTNYATTHGLTLERVYVERGVAGRILLGARPEGSKLLAALKAGDTLITPTLGDLFHSAKAASEGLSLLWAGKVKIHIVGLGGAIGHDTPAAFLTIVKVIAAMEGSRNRERSRSIKIQQRSKGQYLGGDVPFGHRLADDGTLVQDIKAIDALGKAQSLRQQGQSLRAISDILKANGVDLSHVTLRKLLKR